jgi:hypothetical protein
LKASRFGNGSSLLEGRGDRLGIERRSGCGVLTGTSAHIRVWRVAESSVKGMRHKRKIKLWKVVRGGAAEIGSSDSAAKVK